MAATLVTGGTGFLGRHLIARLRAAAPGVPVRVLSRHARAGGLGEGVEVVRGDVTDADAVAAALKGADRVYHLAGLISRDPADAGALYRANVDGTRTVCAASLAAGVARVVIVSTSGTIAVSRTPVVHDERSGYQPDLLGPFPYYLSKMYAEKVALGCAARDGLPVVVASPTLVLGPGGGPESSARDVARVLRGEVFAAPTGGLNLVDVRDVADGLVLAMERGRVAERYLLGGANVSLRRLIAEVCRVAGRPAPRLTLPPSAARLGAGALRRLPSLCGRGRPPSDVEVRMASLYWYSDSGKARRDLGFAPRDPRVTVRETVAELLAGRGMDTSTPAGATAGSTQ